MKEDLLAKCLCQGVKEDYYQKFCRKDRQSRLEVIGYDRIQEELEVEGAYNYKGCDEDGAEEYIYEQRLMGGGLAAETDGQARFWQARFQTGFSL